MGSQLHSRTFQIASGETVAFHLGKAIFPLGTVIRLGSGATVTRKFSTARRPGNKLVSPSQRASLDGSTTTSNPEMETVPYSWLQLNSAGDASEFDVSGLNAEAIVTHSSVSDPITALTHAAITMDVGDNLTFAPSELWNYPKGSVDTTATSADATKVAAVVDPDTGVLGISAVAATTAINVTLTGTTPAELTANLTLSVTVNA